MTNHTIEEPEVVYALSFYTADNDMIVGIHLDGTIELGDLPLEESARTAAEVFWNVFRDRLTELARNEPGTNAGDDSKKHT